MFGWLQKLKVEYYKRVSDQRKYSRVPISVKVTKLDSGVFTYYHATNISNGGMFLKAEEPPDLGSTLLLQFSLPDHDHEIQAEAQVVRVQTHRPGNGHNPSGMGLRFLALEDRDREAIGAFVGKKI